MAVILESKMAAMWGYIFTYLGSCKGLDTDISVQTYVFGDEEHFLVII